MTHKDLMKSTKDIRDPKFEPQKIEDSSNIIIEPTDHVIHSFTRCDHCKNDVHKATKCKVKDQVMWICDYCLASLKFLK